MRFIFSGHISLVQKELEKLPPVVIVVGTPPAKRFHKPKK